MTAKRFYRNRGTIWENDKSLSLGEVEDKLNALYDENEHIKQTIKDMINTERTEIGKSVLKQLYEAIQ